MTAPPNWVLRPEDTRRAAIWWLHDHESIIILDLAILFCVVAWSVLGWHMDLHFVMLIASIYSFSNLCDTMGITTVHNIEIQNSKFKILTHICMTIKPQHCRLGKHYRSGVKPRLPKSTCKPYREFIPRRLRIN